MIYPVTAYENRELTPLALYRRQNMASQVRKCIVRPATAEEKGRHELIRQEIKEELPQISQWSRVTAGKHRDRVAVETVLSAEEGNVLEAMNNYAVDHSLPDRSAMVREALANLLGIDIARQ